MANESGLPEEKPASKRTRKSPLSAGAEVPLPPKVTRELKETTSSSESKSEIASRLRIVEKDAEHERWKERLVLCALMVATSAVVLASLAILVLSDRPNLQSWATAGLSTVLSGFFGYFTAKQGRAK